MVIHLLAPKYSLPKINRLSRGQIYTPNCWRLRSAMCSLTPPYDDRVQMPQKKHFVDENCHIAHPIPWSAHFLTFQHLHCHSHGFFGPVFVNPHRFGHDDLPKATFSQGFTQRQPKGANRRLTHGIWRRDAGSEIPRLNIKCFQQLAAAWSIYHMELLRSWVHIGFHVHRSVFS